MNTISEFSGSKQYRVGELPSLPKEKLIPICPICGSTDYAYLVYDCQSKVLLGCSECTTKLYREDIIYDAIKKL